MTQHKRPESVLVLVYTPDAEILILERRQPAGFFQSVTGSLNWGESHAEAAWRELREETGLDPRQPPRPCGLEARFEIHPDWRHRFPPGTETNHETVFCWQAPSPVPVQINPDEHVSWQWLPFDRAVARVSSWSNRRGLLQVIPMVLG
ncbi:dihydroneopterin triphosphate diphosphatase [Natronospira bacteriovora]|uniref:Dihydroneopterin triphosphate diphosphatase n=1 Tax=Natronospira bacteriovora TaxID=3069753 RepID=A0ABU0W8S8_9GAMM|nr:dihydroneopterin triphosphate diphosphatase [Natronospira sp. AB-CW4]MDQ2070432.1 dihydroneopterin triphosphate diphosphatase [Natronospira sp. AB-CW4]